MNGQERTYGTGRARIIIGLAALCAISWNANAGERVGRDWYRVKVDLNSRVEVPHALLREGQEAATAIFAGIHVQLLWVGRRPDASKEVGGCVGEPDTHDLAVEIIPHAPASLSDIALAMAIPNADSGVRIFIFYDRVDPLLRGHEPEARILGYVLAHEIAHILQGVARHSETGIMRARWTDNDFKLMGSRLLMFTLEDVRLIRHGLVTRYASGDCS
jgi:hypothetical protein